MELVTLKVIIDDVKLSNTNKKKKNQFNFPTLDVNSFFSSALL